jgi:hypothetical protein
VKPHLDAIEELLTFPNNHDDDDNGGKDDG